jgi:ubiquinone/menaquinone biosynthesis C-methylase UbiE
VQRPHLDAHLPTLWAARKIDFDEQRISLKIFWRATMGDDNERPKPHSWEYFGEARDYWWNLDFLELMATRLQFEEVRTVLDAGCGIGHWGQLLARVLPPQTQFTGIDREDRSLARTRERAIRFNVADRFQYLTGDVTAMPFEDSRFDMVTCQTVLIHLKDPAAGLGEMLRVLKPGGLLLAAEPNNFANGAVASSLTEALSIDEVMDRMRFALTIQRGKKALGLGFNSVGDLVPGLLAQLGSGIVEVPSIQVHVSDKAAPMLPPYAGREQQVAVEAIRDSIAREFVGWDRAEMNEYYLAGGGDPSHFDMYWTQSFEDMRAMLAALEDGTYHCSGGALTYLVSARKAQGGSD